MDEGDARLEGRRVRDQREIHDLLHRIRTEQRKAGLARRHHVGVIAENRKPLRGERARGDVKNGGCEFARDFIHVRDHQQQSLASGKRRRQRAGLQCAVNSAGRAGFTLQFGYEGHGAPKVVATFGRPLVGPFTHWRGRRNWINRNNFANLVGNVSRGFVRIQCNFSS